MATGNAVSRHKPEISQPEIKPRLPMRYRLPEWAGPETELIGELTPLPFDISNIQAAPSNKLTFER